MSLSSRKMTPKRPKMRPPNAPQEASKLPPRGPREASQDIQTNIQEASNPQPRHGGGMGRRPLDPPPPVDSSQGCLACWILSVLVLVLFQKNSSWASGTSRRGPGRTRKDCHGPQRPQKILQDGSRWPPRRPRLPKMASKMPPRRPRWPPRRLRWPQDASKTAQDAPKTA